MDTRREQFDASSMPLGRLATRVAVVLMGKDRASFQRHAKAPVEVTITNCDRAVLTGRKWDQKKYYRHSGRIGNLREATAAEVRAKDSRILVKTAIAGMLPKNKLRQRLLKQITFYKAEDR
jgi:large subunit ribosomal protein L13